MVVLKARFMRWLYQLSHLSLGLCAIDTYESGGKVRCLAVGYPVESGKVQIIKVFYGTWP